MQLKSHFTTLELFICPLPPRTKMDFHQMLPAVWNPIQTVKNDRKRKRKICAYVLTGPKIINVLIIFLITHHQCLDFEFQMRSFSHNMIESSFSPNIYLQTSRRTRSEKFFPRAMMDLSIWAGAQLEFSFWVDF